MYEIIHKISTASKSAWDYVRTFRRDRGVRRDSMSRHSESEFNSDPIQISAQESRLCNSIEAYLSYGAGFVSNYARGKMANERPPSGRVRRRTARFAQSTTLSVLEEVEED